MEADRELTVPEDLLVFTVLCPAVELVLALLLTVVVDLGTARLFCPEEDVDLVLSFTVEVERLTELLP